MRPSPRRDYNALFHKHDDVITLFERASRKRKSIHSDTWREIAHYTHEEEIGRNRRMLRNPSPEIGGECVGPDEQRAMLLVILCETMRAPRQPQRSYATAPASAQRLYRKSLLTNDLQFPAAIIPQDLWHRFSPLLFGRLSLSAAERLSTSPPGDQLPLAENGLANGEPLMYSARAHFLNLTSRPGK
ncbi:unnamed protein product [Nesidiocoris tenuis]|uniref:Uncharacterized protein n=1 Tax=Nesidiocoris tenuis TaxID=355587 RepID=A0A6H5GFL2_9HEMI|nr:unnamed protein product [Nesidiocoris tenuis]